MSAVTTVYVRLSWVMCAVAFATASTLVRNGTSHSSWPEPRRDGRAVRRFVRSVSEVDSRSLQSEAVSAVPVHHHRSLLQQHNFFVPLPCNTCGIKQSTWTREAYKSADRTVVIPCGHCITLDYQASATAANTLVLPFGLDIQGTFKVTGATYKSRPLTIVTPFVRVQGKLIMDMFTNAVGSVPLVKIMLTDANSGGPAASTSFVPMGTNAFACSEFASGTAAPCHVGNKPIVVAGGQLDIRGLPVGCSTWVKLHDIPKLKKLPNPSKFSMAPPENPNIFCRGTSPLLMTQSFTAGSPHINEWSAFASGLITVNAGSLVSTGRTDDGKDGIAWDLSRLRGCLVHGRVYVFSFRVRLLSNVPNGTPSTCAQSGKNCLRLTSSAKFASGTVVNNKGTERRVDAFAFGEWNTFHTSLSFGVDELAANVMEHKLVIAGAPANVGIEVDDVSFGVPPPNMYPNPIDVCGGNLILNGDASGSSVDPYPMDITGTGRLSVNLDFFHSRRYFRVQRRTSSVDSVAQYLNAPACIVPGGRYNVRAKVRIVSTKVVRAVMIMRVGFLDGTTSRIVVAECPGSMNSWVDCSSMFAVDFEYEASRVQSVLFLFETEGSTADMDVTDWSVQFMDVTLPEIIVQSAGVQGCWGNGAEVLITSATTDFQSAKGRRVVSEPLPYANGLVRLKLDGFVPPSVTKLDGDGFAVEIALLSRNIVFEGARDNSNSKLGGHLIVLSTPNVIQYIEGVEMRNFGREGEIGRYPIHFHLSANVKGSLVSKNSIRNSNQRCVVVHGTHNLTVSGNVAYDTKGHCYVLEDGGELDNKFIGNLGASTGPTTRLVRPSETDNFIPSTFWISNPANTFIGNVAAGGSGSGYWFELQDSVRSPTSLLPTSIGMAPRKLALQLFSNNIAHSYGQHGLRTYPIGYFPPKQAVFHNTMSYKNKPAGVFFHNSFDLKLQGGVLADNGVQADFDRADKIVVDGTNVIGSSIRFNEIVSSNLVKLGHKASVIGLQFHDFAQFEGTGGATILNVRFTGFAAALSDKVAIIEFDSEVLSGHFDYWSTFRNASIADGLGPAAFDFRQAAAAGVSDIILTDLDSSMKPAGSSAVGVSSIISNSAGMKGFIDAAATCHDFSGLGYLYCRNTCFRTVSFATSPAETEKFVLRITTKSTPKKTFDFPGYYNFETETISGATPQQRNTWIKKHRYFAPPLPVGSYTAQFIDLRNGQPVWPQFVERTDVQSGCSPAVSLTSVELITPNPTCRELINNGNMEQSKVSFSYWLQHDTGIEVVGGAGIGQTNAIADTDHKVSTAYIGQFIDARCLDVGRRFTVQAWVKLVNPQTKAVVRCGTSDRACPAIQLRFRVAGDLCGRSFVEDVVTVSSTFVKTVNDWSLLQGTVTIDARLAGAGSVALVVRRSSTGVKMYLDNISMLLA